MAQYLKEQKDVVDVAEYIQDRLYFLCLQNKREMKNTSHFHYFTTDDTLVYNNYFMDFGPLSLGKLFRFCCILFKKLTQKSLLGKKIVYYTVMENKKRANAAFLISAFAVIYLSLSPNDAVAPIRKTKYPIQPFVDANMNGQSSINTIRIIDCLNGLNRAFYFGLVSFSDFNLAEYELFEGANLENPGDLSWIVPKKLLAFAGPCGERNGNCPVEFYIDYFKENRVMYVVRLNKSRYKDSRFTDHGIRVFDLYFADGTTPSKPRLEHFLQIAEACPGAVAVHCKAGLGRTGCLIGAYLMKHYRMAALEAIAWMRICRPGCVIGHQQAWLEEIQRSMWRAGESYREAHHGAADKMMQHKYGIYSIQAKIASKRINDKNEIGSTVKFKERLKDREMGITPSAGSLGSEILHATQGDLLLSARIANLKQGCGSTSHK